MTALSQAPDACCAVVPGGELLQAGLPNCAVYKAFNTVGDNLLADPDRLGTPVTMFFAGKLSSATISR